MLKIGFRAAVAALAASLSASLPAADWPAWRGPTQNGMAYEKGLPDSSKEVLWRAPLPGRSTPVIVGGRLFGINLAGEGITEQERVFALELETGKPLWEHRFNVFHTDVPNTRVGWASLAADPETGYVYAHGVQGMFLCFDRDGRVVWSRSLTELYGRISGYGGRTHTPIIDEDRVIISFLNSGFGPQAVGAHRYLAMNKRTGEIVWWATPGGKPEDTTYSMPVVAVIDGRRLLVGGNADGNVYAMKARTGEPAWSFKLSQRGINSSVVVDGYRVYASHSEENLDSTAMGRVVAIDGRGSGDVTKSHELWRADGIEAGYASPLVHSDRLYVITNPGVMVCLDAKTGKELWRQVVGRIGKGSPVWADGKIYATTADGRFVILEDQGGKAKLLDRASFRAKGQGAVELFGSPAVSGGRVAFFTTTELICLGKKGAKAQDLPVPPMPAEKPPAPDAAVASVQVRPAEVLLQPGQAVRFQAIGFDRDGRELKRLSPRWAYSTPAGSVSADGAFQAAKRPTGSVGELTASLGELKGTARLRIVPDLPIAEDFESYQGEKLPGSWIGVSKIKYAIEPVGGSKTLEKLSDDRGPIFNRSHVFITPPIEPGYTVEADVMGVQQAGKRGDVGLINDRYVLEMFGGVQRLRVMSWVPGPRFEKRTDLPWATDRWYRLKFRVDVEQGQAHLRAKAWPRDEAEPTDWTIEAVDPQPNLEGSAGLYANSTAPVHFDNVRIYRHGEDAGLKAAQAKPEAGRK